MNNIKVGTLLKRVFVVVVVVVVLVLLLLFLQSLIYVIICRSSLTGYSEYFLNVSRRERSSFHLHSSVCGAISFL